MAKNITLSAPIRSSLLSLQNTSGLINRTEGRLSTGLKVNSAIDDAVSYFQAKALTDRGTDFAEKLDSIDQGISALTTALDGISSIESVLKQMKGIMYSAKSSTDDERRELERNFNELARQMNLFANDASYQGLNLINSTDAVLKVDFSNASNSFLEIRGNDIQISGLFTCIYNVTPTPSNAGYHIVAHMPWENISNAVSWFDSGINLVDKVLGIVQGISKSIGSNVALLQTRLDFTKNYINSQEEGAGKLTLADMNEEGANLVALQTRQQLGMHALQFSGQAEQAVLQLFR